MRRTARVLSAAALAGAAVGLPATAAFADPASEVSPGTASPGGTVTVSVSCESTGGEAPPTIEATSQAFDEGTVQLQRVVGNDERAAGVTYRGTARIASATELEDGGPAAVGPDTAIPDAAAPENTLVPDAAAPDAVGPDAVGPDSVTPDAADPDAVGPDKVPTDAAAPDDAPPDAAAPDVVGSDSRPPGSVGPGSVSPGGVTADSAWTVNGTCPAAPGGHGAAWSATFKVDLGAHASRKCGEQQRTDGCGTAPVQRGVRAGEGGTFTDSVPALVAGGVLIAGALGAAAHRLRHRDSTGGR